jgi:hypothetical protein
LVEAGLVDGHDMIVGMFISTWSFCCIELHCYFLPTQLEEVSAMYLHSITFSIDEWRVRIILWFLSVYLLSFHSWPCGESRTVREYMQVGTINVKLPLSVTSNMLYLKASFHETRRWMSLLRVLQHLQVSVDSIRVFFKFLFFLWRKIGVGCKSRWISRRAFLFVKF